MIDYLGWNSVEKYPMDEETRIISSRYDIYMGEYGIYGYGINSIFLRKVTYGIYFIF